ncbi:hypothetical protein ACFV6G_33740 [Streptomyces lavendulae]|uniref:hypothetical protein n=1 Tax=Streptomyces lavendulae TaxID=1914 RepID=UPI00367D4902
MLIQELARTARALAVEAGQAVSEPVLHDVEQILHAVLADPDVAALWATGRLVKAPDAARGFTGLEPAPRRRGGQPGPPHLPGSMHGRRNRMLEGGWCRRAVNV